MSHNTIFEHIPNLKYFRLRDSVFNQDIHVQINVIPDIVEDLHYYDDEGEHLWRKGSPAIKRLTIIQSYMALKDFHFPEGLVELIVTMVDFAKVSEEIIRFPSTLKRLILGSQSLEPPRSVEFPSGLERLSLKIVEGEWISMQPLRLPNLLKELYLHVDHGYLSPHKSDLVVACTELPETSESLDIKNIECPTLPQGLKELKIKTLARLSHFPPNLEHLEYDMANSYQPVLNWYEELNLLLPSALRYLRLKFHSHCRLNMNINLPELEHVEYHNCHGPVPSSVKSVTFCPRERYRDFAVPYGVRKLKTEFNLKEYPDSILDLEIENFYPRTAPPFPKNVRYLGLCGKSDFHINDLKLPPSLYKLSGTFDKEELQKFNLKARKPFGVLAEAIHSGE